jgi:2'-5' RNA ligase
VTKALEETTFVFRLADAPALTLDEAYALLSEDAAGVLFPDGVPGDDDEIVVAAANAGHTGAMVALVPSQADIERLAVEGGEAPEDLHLTLAFLGEAALIDQEMRQKIIQAGMSYFSAPITSEASGIYVLNPHTDERETAIVAGVRGEDLVGPRENVMSALRGMMSVPDNFQPWLPHVTLEYNDDVTRANDYVSRLGPVTFDTLRFAFGDEVTDIPLRAPGSDVGGGEALTAAVNRVYAQVWTDEVDLLLASMTLTDLESTDTVAEPETLAHWSGVLTLEGIESGDGRLFRLGSLDWAQLPQPLMYQPANVGGHNGSVLVGQIQNIFRDGNKVYGSGIIDLDAKFNGELIGREVFRLMSENFLNGVSVDVDKVKDADVEYKFGNVPGEPVGPYDKPVMTVFNRGRIRGATLVAFPAFVEASIHLSGDVLTASAVGRVLTMEDCGCDGQPLVAAAHTITIPDVPPAWWFTAPSPDEIKGAFTITDEGRVFGCLAPAGVTHRSVKRKVPRNVDYSRYMGAETLVAGADGSIGRVKTGPVTFNCGHADTDPKVYGTLENRKNHYDNSCSVFADIAIGEDKEGNVWVAGAIKPFVQGAQIQQAMSCRLSGDWQPHPDRPGVTEFIAALLVPVPGFASARKEASVTLQEGALVASTIPVEFKFNPGQKRDGDGRWTDGGAPDSDDAQGSGAKRLLANPDNASPQQVIKTVKDMDRSDWDKLSADEKSTLRNIVQDNTAGEKLFDEDDDELTDAGYVRDKIKRWQQASAALLTATAHKQDTVITHHYAMRKLEIADDLKKAG